MCNLPTTSLLDIVFKVATILIAVINLGYAFYIFRYKDRKEQNEKEADLNIYWLINLILNHNLHFFYEFINSIEVELSHLKTQGITDETKVGINANVGDQFSTLRIRFIDVLMAVDSNLYSKILDEMDKLQDHITETIFDPGINLSYEPKYQEKLLEAITRSKTDVIRVLFNYRG